MIEIKFGKVWKNLKYFENDNIVVIFSKDANLNEILNDLKKEILLNNYCMGLDLINKI